MDIGLAVQALNEGKKVAREGWNGKQMYLVLVRGVDYQLNTIAQLDLVGATQIPWVGMRTAQDTFVPWVCSQTDLLAMDWVIIP